MIVWGRELPTSLSLKVFALNSKEVALTSVPAMFMSVEDVSGEFSVALVWCSVGEDHLLLKSCQGTARALHHIFLFYYIFK